MKMDDVYSDKLNECSVKVLEETDRMTKLIFLYQSSSYFSGFKNFCVRYDTF